MGVLRDVVWKRSSIRIMGVFVGVSIEGRELSYFFIIGFWYSVS